MQAPLLHRGRFHRRTAGCLGAALLLLAPVIRADLPRPPNILLILCDDLGPDDLGSAGNPWARTPHLDTLAARSVRFSDFTVNPVCAPSRATLLTGRHFLRTGVAHVHGGKDYVHRNEVLLPQRLRDAGYATGMWGKWHSGTTAGYLPWERGFGEVYMADLYRHRATTGTVQGGSRVAHPGWADAVIVDYAIDFIRRHRTQPFFAFVSTMTPHGRHDAPEELVATYQNRGLGDGPARLFAMIEFLDTQIGRLLTTLESEGLANDTVVLFLSDNGPNHDGHFSPEERALRRVDDLRGWKGDIWEGGVRSPFFVRWPQHFKPRQEQTPVQMADIFPTICALAGASLPPTGPALDGANLLLLLGSSGPHPTHPIFNYASPGWPPSEQPYSPIGIRDEYRPVAPEEKAGLEAATQVISWRDDPFKLLLNADLNRQNIDYPRDDYTLIHLPSDPGETTDVKSIYPIEFSRLRAALIARFEEVKREPHSFAAPRFMVSSDQAPEIRIPASAPSRLSSGLLNTVHGLHGWTTAGQFADFDLEVDEPLNVAISLGWTQPVNDLIWEARILPETPQVSDSGEPLPPRVEPGLTTLRILLKANSPSPLVLESLILHLPKEKGVKQTQSKSAE